MKFARIHFSLVASVLFAFSASGADKTTYQDNILPLIQANCAKCHNEDKKKADLDLTSYQGALKGSGSGAVLVSETGHMAKEAGLADIVLKSKPGYVEALTDWEDPLYKKLIELLPAGSRPADFITSLEVQAVKPGGECCGSDCSKS